jgi:uncharacterized protein YidB (DUF937 family)
MRCKERKRDPEAEDLGDGGDIGVGEALVLEERHRHCTRNVARHAETRDEQQDRDRHRAEPLKEVEDRRPDRLDKAGVRLLLKGVGSNNTRASADQGPLGGLLGSLSGAVAGGGVGGLLGGGSGELLDRFKQNGQGDAAESWINKGPNKELPPPELKQAIGADVLAALEQQTGLSQQELLVRLSRELPSAVDQYTPDGRIPA